ncbi:MAG: type II toxin-antitoxin system HicB family antitoxin [Vulcanimicrobiaceae bacterium]
MKYAVVIESTATGYSAYVPDLPGCVSTGATLADIEREIAEAIALHLQGMRSDGEPIPEPTTVVEMIAVEAA